MICLREASARFVSITIMKFFGQLVTVAKMTSHSED
jgi:hypothetical protein